MNAPEWPPSDLVEFYHLFLAMRRQASADARIGLAFELVLHPAAQTRLVSACPAVLRRLAAHAGLGDDLRQESMRLLAGWLSAETLNYADAGIDAFGCWYWTLCRRASRRALDEYRPRSSSVDFVDAETLMTAAASPGQEHRYDRLTRAIAAIADERLRSIVLDWRAGISISESAAHHQLSHPTVVRLRREARRLLHGLYDSGAADED